MAFHYVKQQVGVADGTNPPDRADGREVVANKVSTLASKVPGTAWASADRIYLGKRPAGYKLVAARVTSDTSLSTSTLAIGSEATADKYVAAQGSLTATDTSQALKVKASTLDDDPVDEEEALWATVGTAAIASATLLTIELEFVGIS
jgi:hypothetical protein